VRGVNDEFVFQSGIGTFEFADHVVRFERAQRLFDVNVRFRVQRHRPEILSDCGPFQRVEILAAIGKKFLRDIDRDPRARRDTSRFCSDLSSSKFSFAQLDLTTCHGYAAVRSRE